MTVRDQCSATDHSKWTHGCRARKLTSGRADSAVPLSSTRPMKTPVVLEVGRFSTNRRRLPARNARDQAEQPEQCANHRQEGGEIMRWPWRMLRADLRFKSVYRFKTICRWRISLHFHSRTRKIQGRNRVRAQQSPPKRRKRNRLSAS